VKWREKRRERETERMTRTSSDFKKTSYFATVEKASYKVCIYDRQREALSVLEAEKNRSKFSLKALARSSSLP
jgi:hypothetical protein